MLEEIARENVLKYFEQRFNCAEASLMGLAETFGIESDAIPQIATGLGGGLGRHGEVCGAVLGAVMALGLKYGRKTPDNEAKEHAYNIVHAFLSAFEKEYGSIKCLDLTGIDMLTPEGMAKAKELNLHKNICPKYVAAAAEMAARLMQLPL